MNTVLLEMTAFTALVLLALIFVQAAWHKAADYGRFLGFVANYQLVPEFLEGTVARLLILAEILLVALLVFPATTQVAALGLALLLLVYAFGMSINLLRGRRLIDCGCGGSAHPVSWLLVLRNLLLAGLALLPASQGISQPGSLELLVALLAGAGLWLLYNLLGKILGNTSHLATLRQP